MCVLYMLKKRKLLDRLRDRLPELDETRFGKANVEAFIGIGLLPEEGD